MPPDELDKPGSGVSRRAFVGGVVAAGLVTELPAAAPAEQNEPGATIKFSLTINGQHHDFDLDPRTSLLDLLREHLHFTGTKKGCDHGQCGACTVLLNGVRINSCLTFAVVHDGETITTIEGLANGQELHPMQAAFIEHDGLQCGYCTPGQICSAVAMLKEAHAGAPSFVTQDVSVETIELSDDEIRERMSGNICRCGAYPNIVAAIRSVKEGARS